MTERHAICLPAFVPRGAVDLCLVLAGKLGSMVDPSANIIEPLRAETLEKLGESSEVVPARVAASVLCDLVLQGWLVASTDGTVTITPPNAIETDALAEKQRVRSGHLVERDFQLRDPAVRGFIAEMEQDRLHKRQWRSIFSLMRDGSELSAALRAAASGGDHELKGVVDPYIQFVDSDQKCRYTGIRLTDIWRYFRYTWSTAHKSIPGRRMFVLIRDRAAECHPVIGIAALGSAVVQLSVRDEWIGWTLDSFLANLGSYPGTSRTWLLLKLTELIGDLYTADFIEERLLKRSELAAPTAETVRRLQAEARRARRAHERYPNPTGHKAVASAPFSSDWERESRTFLFRSKRAATLADLLAASITFNRVRLRTVSDSDLAATLNKSAVRKAVASVLKGVKARHVGIDILDITVCGAIPPYSHLLGGKLVALLLMSPEVREGYYARYSEAPSVIASGMKGELVLRAPRLVLLSTTSLYGVASSQYNRIKISKESYKGLKGDLEYKPLGKTVGFGSYHFSEASLHEMSVLAAQRRDGRRVNSIFGEGINPRLRKIREALDAAGFPSDVVLRHGSPRLVYGVSLAANFREVLQELEDPPKYLFESSTTRGGTDMLSSFWRTRWLSRRIQSDKTLNDIEMHKTNRPVSHGARVKMPPAYENTGISDYEEVEVEAWQ